MENCECDKTDVVQVDSQTAASNPYKVGVPIQKQAHINTAILSGVIGPEDFKANKPMTQAQADRLWEYSKRRYRHLPSGD